VIGHPRLTRAGAVAPAVVRSCRHGARLSADVRQRVFVTMKRHELAAAEIVPHTQPAHPYDNSGMSPNAVATAATGERPRISAPPRVRSRFHVWLGLWMLAIVVIGF